MRGPSAWRSRPNIEVPVPVYVDASANPLGRMVMCHMMGDTPAELRAMANTIGVDLRWFQSRASAPHFDIARSKRALAFAAGAVELDRRAFVEMMKRVRQAWPVSNGRWVL
jgi:hypothetical protein